MLAPEQFVQQRYLIRQILGQGGFGAVYMAWDSRLNREVALKATFDRSPEALRQFEHEATLLAHLQHPNLPVVSDHFADGNEHYVVMDYIPGEDLGTHLEKAGVFDAAKAVSIMLPILDALAYMHGHNPPIIHRDIKPDNIRITPDNTVYLVDFGLAKLFDANGKTTAVARAVTPGFSPIEQYGKGTTDVRSDIYAAGATLYTLLTGCQPPEAIARYGNDSLASVRQLQPSVSPQLDMIVMRMVAMDPAHRYQSATDVISDLLAVHSQIICASCGVQSSHLSKFCSSCGAQLLGGASSQGPTVAINSAGRSTAGGQRYKRGDSQRYDTFGESPARAVLDTATIAAVFAMLLPWTESGGYLWNGITLFRSPFGFQYEVIVAVFALVALLLLLFVRRQVAATRTALARWKLLLGVTVMLPALDIVLSNRYGNNDQPIQPYGGVWFTIGIGAIIVLAASSDILGWRLPADAFEPGYARVIRGAHIATVGLIILCGLLTLATGHVGVASLRSALLLGVLVGIGIAASFLIPDRLPRTTTAVWVQP